RIERMELKLQTLRLDLRRRVESGVRQPQSVRWLLDFDLGVANPQAVNAHLETRALIGWRRIPGRERCGDVPFAITGPGQLYTWLSQLDFREPDPSGNKGEHRIANSRDRNGYDRLTILRYDQIADFQVAQQRALNRADRYLPAVGLGQKVDN